MASRCNAESENRAPKRGGYLASESSFTLIELLVVIAILGVLATAVILVINPAELLKGARDSTRLSDLASLNSALNLFQVDQYNQSLGTSSVVYVSVPDNSPTCASLGLPVLPGGWSYSCSNSTNYQKVDGTGWIPVNFTLLSTNSPLSRLPIDPINSASTGQYYTYTPGGSWELTMMPESAKQKMGGGSDKTSTDGGSYPDLYEIGSSLSLLPVDRDPALVGYWKFDEGSGTTAYDASGHGKDGSWGGTPAGLGGTYYATGKVGSYAGQFNGTDDRVVINVSSPTELTKMAWIKFDASQVCVGDGVLCDIISPYFHIRRDQLNLQFYSDSLSPSGWHSTSGGTLTNNQWQHVAVSYGNGTLRLYINGLVAKEVSATRTSSFNSNYIGADNPTGRLFYGSIDDVRIYNRALSAAEILAIYNTH